MKYDTSWLHKFILFTLVAFMLAACNGNGSAKLDSDMDGTPDVTDTDDDNDGVLDAMDAFPLNSAESLDTDGDGIGNNADDDDDGDMVADSDDAFPLDATETIDSDGDGMGDNADTDDDNDGVVDTADAFPFDNTESLDTDDDGIGNNADDDDDGDLVADVDDAFPLDATETIDSDKDGIGNNADPDDDNDNVLDPNDDFPLNAARSMPIQPLYPLVNGEFQIPDWPSMRQLTWLIEQLAAPSTTIEDIEAHYAPSALAITPAPTIQAFIDGLRATVPSGKIVDVIIASPTQMQVLFGDPSDLNNPGLFITVNTRYFDGGQILSSGSPSFPLNTTSVGPAAQGLSMVEAAEQYAALTENSSLLVAQINEDNICVPIFENNADIARPLARQFQSIWTLGALAEEIDAGTISAVQEIPLDVNILTTLGPFGFEPPGALIPVEDLAGVALGGEPAANDHIHELVGRTAVEAALSELGHQNIPLMTPFLKASDYFNLVFRVTEGEALGFVNGTEEAQRTFVDTVLAPLGPYNLVTAPPFRNGAVQVSGSMRASPNDVCAAIARFRQYHDRSDAFSIIDHAYGGRAGGLGVRSKWERVWVNFGVSSAIDGGTFRNLVISYSFLIETDDRGAFVVVALSNNADDSLTNTPFIPAFSPLNRILEIIDETN